MLCGPCEADGVGVRDLSGDAELPIPLWLRFACRPSPLAQGFRVFDAVTSDSLAMMLLHARCVVVAKLLKIRIPTSPHLSVVEGVVSSCVLWRLGMRKTRPNLAPRTGLEGLPTGDPELLAQRPQKPKRRAPQQRPARGAAPPNAGDPTPPPQRRRARRGAIPIEDGLPDDARFDDGVGGDGGGEHSSSDDDLAAGLAEIMAGGAGQADSEVDHAFEQAVVDNAEAFAEVLAGGGGEGDEIDEAFDTDTAQLMPTSGAFGSRTLGDDIGALVDAFAECLPEGALSASSSSGPPAGNPPGNNEGGAAAGPQQGLSSSSSGPAAAPVGESASSGAALAAPAGQPGQHQEGVVFEPMSGLVYRNNVAIGKLTPWPNLKSMGVNCWMHPSCTHVVSYKVSTEECVRWVAQGEEAPDGASRAVRLELRDKHKACPKPMKPPKPKAAPKAKSKAKPKPKRR